VSERVTVKAVVTIYSSGRVEILCEGSKADCDVVTTVIRYSLKMADEVVGIMATVVVARVIDEIMREVSRSREGSGAGVI
jgi:hypothetical protein